jgi:hypothetical protein
MGARSLTWALGRNESLEREALATDAANTGDAIGVADSLDAAAALAARLRGRRPIFEVQYDGLAFDSSSLTGLPEAGTPWEVSAVLVEGAGREPRVRPSSHQSAWGAGGGVTG